MFKKIFSHIGQYKKQAILSPIVMVGEVLMEVTIPLVMAKLVDVGIQGDGGMSYILKMGLLMMAMALCSMAFGAAGARIAAKASIGLGANLRSTLFAKIQAFSFKNTDRFSTSSLVMRLTTDITNTQMAFQMIIRALIRAPLIFILALVMCLSLNLKLSIIFAVAIPLLIISILLVTTKAFPIFKRMFKKYDKLNADVQENLTGIRVVKSFVREDYERKKFSDSAGIVRDYSLRAEKYFVLTMPLIQFTMYGCMIAISWLGANDIIGGSMLTGELISFISYSTQILMSLMMVAMVFVMIVMSRESMARIVEVLDEQIDITDTLPAADETPEVADGSVVFDNVSFSYNNDGENLNLENINLSIAPGESIGIIGGTGSSKTTLVQLIPRLYDVYEGSVKVGGRNVKDYPLDSLRNKVAMVLQKNVLFSGTIAENLRWGDEHATDEEIITACKKAQAHDFIMSFPDGYQTVLGQGGVNVSGGQKQRLCIARALLKKPKVIILDDSTSAVDTATDSRIRAALTGELTDTTTIIIAQRISSISECDRIIVLNDGKIDAIGTHEQLLEQNEIYREVYHSQQKGVA